MMRPLFPLALVSLLAACAQSEAPAATTAASAASSAPAQAAAAAGELSATNHVLTTANVDAFFAIQRNFAVAIQADPELDPAMNISEEDTATYAARLEATPALRAAITQQGISVREYAMTSEALLGALMAQGALDAGLLQELPEGLNPQHVEFVRTNKARIEAMARSIGDLGNSSRDDG